MVWKRQQNLVHHQAPLYRDVRYKNSSQWRELEENIHMDDQVSINMGEGNDEDGVGDIQNFQF